MQFLGQRQEDLQLADFQVLINHRAAIHKSSFSIISWFPLDSKAEMPGPWPVETARRWGEARPTHRDPPKEPL
jgi:hypothetical protein